MLSAAIPTYFLVLCTAYSPSFEECGKTDGITASGIRAVEGETIAADDLPLGTKVEINGAVVSTENKIVGEMAEAVRDGKIDKITVYFE